ncbi:MAG: hypothetical protein IJD79_00475 [Clostridia bacterium]|nr:hypothetical protein [Clostridia bacterium]
MNFCPKCRKKLVVQDFCVECGADLSQYLNASNQSESLDSFDFSALEREAGKQLAFVSKFTVGASVSYGSYYINNRYNKDPIEWIVVAKEDGRALLLSKYALDFKTYHIKNEYVVWKDCSLRAYLNGEFLYNCFDLNEQSRILNTQNEDSCVDKIFLLSEDEFNKYIKNTGYASCKATPYVMSLDTVSFTGDIRSWWLRSTSCGQIYSLYYAKSVYAVGEINNSGDGILNNLICIRPAMWIDLN